MSGPKLLKKKNKIAEFIFFSNYFYGICAVALSIEAVLQQGFHLNGFIYFFLVFITTVLYYGYPYVRKCTVISSNPRTNWYNHHYGLMRWNQVIITAILIISLFLFLSQYWRTLLSMPPFLWLLIFIFPAVGFLYYGINFLSVTYNLRKIGWLKPFIIGFAWAGLVTIYPVLFYCIIHNIDYAFSWQSVLLFLKNLFFVAVLCIMFDFKDCASDHMTRLRTFVVGIGLRRTILYILLPLSVAGLVSFIFYSLIHHFHPGKILLNIIPFILLIITSYSFRKRRHLMYYLVVIDGLMLVKALCGTVAIQLF